MICMQGAKVIRGKLSVSDNPLCSVEHILACVAMAVEALQARNICHRYAARAK